MNEKFELNVNNSREASISNYNNNYNSYYVKKRIILITIIFLIISIAIVIFLMISLINDNNEKYKDKKFKILIENEKINKPFTYNLESEVIQLENGIKAILIREPYSNSSSIAVLSNYGYSLDVIPGLAHFSEHMSFRGSKKYRDNKYWTGFNYIGTINDAFTTLDNTCFYLVLKTGIEYEQFLDIISDYLQNPLLNSSIIKKEINVVNSEFLRSNRTDDYILNNILTELANIQHPFYNQFGVGNNISLNSISEEEMAKYLRAYFQHAYNPNNLNIVLYSNKTISELENLAVKYFNYEISITEKIGNDVRDAKRKKIKEERLFNKDNGGKIVKYHSKIAENLNDSSIYNLLTFSFGINNLTYNNGFNPIDFIEFLFYDSKNSYLNNYLIQHNYLYLLNCKIYPQFLGTEFGLFHIYVYLTEYGINNLEEVIKVIFHYLNLIKNNIDDIEKNIFPNYQKYKLNKFKYYYDENKNLNDLNKQFILNMQKHGLSNIFKNDVPDKFDKNLFLKFLDDNMNIENAIIGLNSNYDISNIDLLKGYSIKYANYYGTQYNVTNLSPEFIELLKKYPVDEKYTDSIKVRDANTYFTNILNPTKPCFLISKEECENKNEFNLINETKYKKDKCNDNDTFLCYYINDRSLNFSKVEIVLKIKSQQNQVLTPTNKIYFNALYLQPMLNFYFKDFLEDPNNDFTISYNDDLIITISTYKDLAISILDKFIDQLLSMINEEEFKYLINFFRFQIYAKIGYSYLNLEEYNKGAIFDLFEFGNTNNYPNYGYSLIDLVNIFTYNNANLVYSYFIESFVNKSLYLIGDLDDDLISNISKIVDNKIDIHTNSFINDNDFIYEFNPDNNNNYNTNIFNDLFKINQNNNPFNLINNIKVNNILNKFSEIMSNKDIPDNTVVNYIYSNNNTFERESYTGLFYNIKMLNQSYNLHFNLFIYSVIEKIFTELRTKRGLGYHALIEYVTVSSSNIYLFFFVQGPMKTPIDVQDEIQSVLYEILNNWDCEDFDKIKNNYIDYIQLLQSTNTFSKRVKEFITDTNNINNNNLDNNYIIPDNYKEVVDCIRNIFENPIRIGIFEYANYIDSEFINKEIENRKNETYFLNKDIKVVYTTDINYFNQ